MSARPAGSSFGKPDHTGRSSGKLTGRIKKLKAPPKGEPWCWLTSELLGSAAWTAMSPNTTRLVHFLMVEHMNHAGTENGNLLATYDQLAEYGCSRRLVSEAIAEATFLGLVSVERGGRWADTNQPSRYCLTWLYSDRDGTSATNRWKGVTEEAITKWKKGRRRRRTKTKPRLTIVNYRSAP